MPKTKVYIVDDNYYNHITAKKLNSTLFLDHKPFTDTDKIISFLEGTTKDYRDRTFYDIISCNDETLECCHDQFQQIFPLHEKSNFASTYPILTQKTTEKTKESKKIYFNMLLAIKRIEQFYGVGQHLNMKKIACWFNFSKPIELNHKKTNTISSNPEYDRFFAIRNVTIPNHNFLRITRIIRSLRLLGLEKEAKEFYNNVISAVKNYMYSLSDSKDIESNFENSKKYWDKALNDNVWNTLK